jgi:hypothetical protein
MGWLGAAMRSVIPTILRFGPPRSVSRPSTGLSWPRGSKLAIRRKHRACGARRRLRPGGNGPHGALERLGTFMGTTAEKVTRHVTYSVLVVR